MIKRRFAPGDHVRLTGDFLRWTGQIAGGAGQSIWTVVECPCSLCRDGKFVATNQPSVFDDDTDDGRDQHCPRHINAHNLERARERS
jgi:hypothetical protein